MAEQSSTTTSIELNDAMVCQHFKEQCSECNADFRQENDEFFGVRGSRLAYRGLRELKCLCC